MFGIFDELVDNFFDSIPKTKMEYELKYNWGGWVTMCSFKEETDYNAILKANDEEKPGNDVIEYALFKGKKMIKNYA